MDAFEALMGIMDTPLSSDPALRWCFVDANKVPHTEKGGTAKPNEPSSFSPFLDLAESPNAMGFSGVGVSVNFSDLCAVDVDKCFSEPFDVTTADDRVLEIIDMFDGYAYIEFSFSGKGCRVLFRDTDLPPIDQSIYYTKNTANHIEFYTSKGSYRYVTVTGRWISLHKLTERSVPRETIQSFLDRWMKRPPKAESKPVEDDGIDPFKKLRYFLLTDVSFQESWFKKAPGSGHDESETDFRLIKFIYEHISADPDTIIKVFETSPFFQTKDAKHYNKFTRNDYAYVRGILDKMG